MTFEELYNDIYHIEDLDLPMELVNTFTEKEVAISKNQTVNMELIIFSVFEAVVGEDCICFQEKIYSNDILMKLGDVDINHRCLPISMFIEHYGNFEVNYLRTKDSQASP